MNTHFDQKTFWISGGARGIGRAFVLELVQAGAHVIFGDRDTGGIQETLALADQIQPGKAAAVACDFAQPEVWDQLETATPDHFPPLYGLIHNAGINPSKRFHETTSEEYQTTLAVNQHAAWSGIQKSLPSLTRTQGVILLISSIMLECNASVSSAYTCSKGAMTGMARALSVELAEKGIRINTLLPGYIMLDPPDLYRNYVPPALWDKFSETFRNEWEPFFRNAQPLKTPGTPRDIARAGLFLLSSEASFITGVELPVDGGTSRVGLFYNPKRQSDFIWTNAMQQWLEAQR